MVWDTPVPSSGQLPWLLPLPAWPLGWFEAANGLCAMAGLWFCPIRARKNCNGKQYEIVDRERKSDDLMASSAIAIALIDKTDIW